MLSDDLDGSLALRKESWTRIFVDSLAIEMFIGVHPHEKTSPQKVLVSVSARLLSFAPGTDDLSATVSYSDIVQHIRDLAAAGHIALVETFAERIAAACLRDPGIAEVLVRVVKPQAYPEAQGVGVTICRSAAWQSGDKGGDPR